MQEAANPYAAPRTPATTALPPPLPYDARRAALAGRGERLLATIIDRLLYGACLRPALLAAAAGGRGFFGLAVAAGFLAMAGLLVYNLVLLGERGQTLGKRWLKIRIVRSDGSDAELGRIFGLRMFVPWLLGFFVGPFFVLPDLLCIFGAERKCLHDMFADTIVVDA